MYRYFFPKTTSSVHRGLTVSSFVQDGFLKDLFKKNPSVPKDKSQILIEKFGEAANSTNFSSQAQATNIQPTTLSLIFSIAFYAASRSWDNFSFQFISEFGDIYDGSDDILDESSVDEPDEDKDDLSINLKGLQMRLQYCMIWTWPLLISL
jgi:hypothetical protein